MENTSQTILRMTLLLAVSFIFALGTCRAQIKDPWKGKPDSIQESFLYLDQMFDDTAKYTFLTFPEDIATTRLHNGFGRWMRNNWGLWGSGSLKKELIDSGFVHPDALEDTIIVNLHASYTKMFQEYSSHLQGTAVVRSRSGGELSVELLSIEQKKRHEPEHKEGDLFQVSPLYCELIPPKGWRPPSH